MQGHRFSDRLLNICIALFTLTMLVLAGLYIGGSQFFGQATALRTVSLPGGAVRVGESATPSHTEDPAAFLPVAFVGIKQGERTAGAFGAEEKALSALSAAAPALHDLLGAQATLTESGEAAFSAALAGDFFWLQLQNPLPYQILYAMTGEYTAPAGSANPISADILLLTLTGGQSALYLTDGTHYFKAENPAAESVDLAAFAEDDSLSDFAIADGKFCVSRTAPAAVELSLSLPDAFLPAEKRAFLTFFRYDPDRYSADGASLLAVEPHGRFSLTTGKLSFVASYNSGLPLSDYLDVAKNELDVTENDVLIAAGTLVSRLRAIAPAAFGETLTPVLTGFYREGDLYTLTFGLCADAIPIGGDALPEWARITVQADLIRSVEMRPIVCSRSGYTLPSLPADWHYNFARREAEISAFFFRYTADELPAAELRPAWYYRTRAAETEAAV